MVFKLTLWITLQNSLPNDGKHSVYYTILLLVNVKLVVILIPKWQDYFHPIFVRSQLLTAKNFAIYFLTLFFSTAPFSFMFSILLYKTVTTTLTKPQGIKKNNSQKSMEIKNEK